MYNFFLKVQSPKLGFLTNYFTKIRLSVLKPMFSKASLMPSKETPSCEIEQYS